jgi:predicted MFS family arabinose efflux permease
LLYSRIAVKTAFFVNGFIYANWASRLPRIQETFHADDGQISLVLLSSSLGAVAAMPFAGWMIIKNGSRRITLVTAILYCALVPLIPILPNLISLILLYLMMGVATGMLDVAMNAQAVVVERAYNRPIMTSFHALFSIGMALGGWCGAYFSSIGTNLTYHFSIVVGIALLALAWSSRNLIRDKPDPNIKHDGPLFQLPNQAMVSIGIITFCCMLGEGAMSDWSVNYMENIVGSSKSTAPIALTAFATAMTVGRIFGDGIRLKLSDRKMIITGGVLATIGLLFPLLYPITWISIAGFFFVGLGLSTIVPIGYSIAGNSKELPPGVGLAMVTTVGYSGFLFGPPIIGFISEAQNLRFALVIVAILFFIMTLLGIRYRQRQ